MAVRKIDYKVSAAGITPGVEQFGGVQIEHKATCLSFTVDSTLKEAVLSQATGGKAVYRFDGYDGEGNVVRGEPQELKEDTVPVFYLEEWITRHGGRIRVYLVISVIKDDSTEMELYSFPANLRLNNLPEGEDKEGENYESLTTLAQSAKESAKVAAVSMNAAIVAQHKTESAKVSLEEDVEIHFLGGDAASAVDIELVVDDKPDEYSSNPVQNKVFAERLKVDYLVARGTHQIEGDIKWNYELWASGKAECWGTTTRKIAIQETFGSIYYGVAEAVSYPSKVVIGETVLDSIFVKTPICDINQPIYNGAVFIGIGANGTAAKSPAPMLFRGTSRNEQTYTLSFRAVGRWK